MSGSRSFSRLINYFRYHLQRHTSCKTAALCQDQFQTREMPTENISSQPEERALVGTGTKTASVRAGILHSGVLGKIAMLSADRQGTITGCSEGALNIFGNGPAAVLGHPLAAFFLHEDGAERDKLQQTMLTEALK